MSDQKVTRPADPASKPSSGRRSVVGGFDHAWRGVAHAVVTQRNMRFHVVAAVVVVAAGFALRVDAVEFSVLVLAIAVVMAAEVFNTAVEAVVDLVTEDRHPRARAAKDAASGAVLVCSVGAAVAGILVFYDEVYALLVRLAG